jgi:hypothetical protein
MNLATFKESFLDKVGLVTLIVGAALTVLAQIALLLQ